MKFILFYCIILFLGADEINFEALSALKKLNSHSSHKIKSFDIKNAKKATEATARKDTWLDGKVIEFEHDMANAMRSNPTPQRTISGEITIINRNSAISRGSSINRAKPNGVKKLYISSKRAQGQDLYIIKCYNGRSISGVWRKSSGLWMSVSTSFGHRGQSIDEVARDYCR